MHKQQQRKAAYAAREAQPDKDRHSAEICRRFVSQSWYQSAQTVLWYVHIRSEVRTLPALQQQCAGQKRIVVPYCTLDESGNNCLGLWRLQQVDELLPGMWNIPEPPLERRLETDRWVSPVELDVVMVPGLAFDRQGGRLGNGAGYYDRLLSQLSDKTVLVGVGYQSQIFPEVIMQSHDVYLDYVLTEQALYSGLRSAG